MKYFIVILVITLVVIYFIHEKCQENNKDTERFIAACPSTEHDLENLKDNHGEAKRSFGNPVYLNDAHYNYICDTCEGVDGKNKILTSNKCDTIDHACICGRNCCICNCNEPRWKWNAKWIERAKASVKKQEQDALRQIETKCF